MAHLASISRRTVAALIRFGAGLWSVRCHRTQEDALRLHVAHLGEELLSALAPLPARCETLRESNERLVRADPLSGLAEHSPLEQLKGLLTHAHSLQRLVQEAMRDLMTLHGRELENRSDRLAVLDLEIWLLVEDLDDWEALWAGERLDGSNNGRVLTGLPASQRVQPRIVTSTAI